MATLFPTLSDTPAWPITEEIEDATVSSGYEAGYEHTRPRYTRTRKKFSIKHENMTDADKSALETFVSTVRGGAGAFTWTHPYAGTSHSVRFNQVPKFDLVAPGLWNCDYILKEV